MFELNAESHHHIVHIYIKVSSIYRPCNWKDEISVLLCVFVVVKWVYFSSPINIIRTAVLCVYNKI